MTGSTSRRTLGFWLLAATAVAFFAASSAPSPLYLVYQARWHFSELTLTLVFAVYALVLLAALLTLGGLSDFVGRRRVIAGALVVEIASMVLFLSAHSVAALFAARAVQGLATGAVAGALAGAVLDLAPAGRGSLASAVNTASPAGGLAVGAILSGALVQWAPAPRVLVYAILTVLFVAMLAALALVPEVVTRRPGALASLKPRAAVPPAARGAFRVAAPVLIATWAVGGLILSVGPTVGAVIFGLDNYFVGGLVVVAITAVSSAASVAVRNRAGRATMAAASLVLAAGVGIVLVSIALTSTVTFFVGLAVAGAGFGSAFVAAIGSVAPLAAPAQRAELFAALYSVSYGSFGLSAVLIGLSVPHAGLRPSTYGFGAVVIALALAAAGTEYAGRALSARRRARTVTAVTAGTEGEQAKAGAEYAA